MPSWPQYAMSHKDKKHLLVQYRCRGCHLQRYGVVSKEDWTKNEPGVSVMCLKCRHIQDDSYNWMRLK